MYRPPAPDTTLDVLAILDMLALAHMAPEAEQQRHASQAQATIAQLREKLVKPIDYDQGGAA